MILIRAKHDICDPAGRSKYDIDIRNYILDDERTEASGEPFLQNICCSLPGDNF